MKRKNSRYRPMAPLVHFVTPPVDDSPRNLFRPPSAGGHPRVRAKKIFVIKQVTLLPARGAATGKKVRRILIFDDHPDSLRLLLGRHVNRHAHRAAGGRAKPRQLILPGVALIAALIAMFWPLL